MKEKFDYIIIGGGCAGLSLAFRMSNEAYFQSKSILLIEPEEKNQNDRTWSYWSKEDNFYNDWAIKNWGELSFKSTEKEIPLDINPYKFYTIRGIDFYNATLPLINSCSQITQIKTRVNKLTHEDQVVKVSLENGKEVIGGFCFDSRINNNYDFEDSNFVWQHFKGWVVESKQDYFDDSKAMFMDFSIDQKQDTRFFYVLPYSKTKALIQIAIFSNDIISSKDYDTLIKDYIDKQHATLDYSILEEEYDKIPMTDFAFPISSGPNHMYIGTASGMVKASSGFAFKRMQDQSDDIIKLLTQGKDPTRATQKIANKKYRVLDGTFLNVILTNRLTGQEVFTRLLSRNKAKNVFDFLNQQSSIIQELKIMSSLPTLPFLKSFFKVLKG